MKSTLITVVVFAALTSLANAERILFDDFNGKQGELIGRVAKTGQTWKRQTAKWSKGSLSIDTRFGQRSPGVGHRAPGGSHWRGNVIPLGRTLRQGTFVFGVDLRHGLGVIESCTAIEATKGKEGLTLIWSGRTLKCGGNSWKGEIDLGIATGSVRVEVILNLNEVPGKSTAKLRYMEIGNPRNKGSVDIGCPRYPDFNGSGSFEFAQVALHVLKGDTSKFGFDNVTVDQVDRVPELKARPIPQKRLFLDNRIIAKTENCELRVGTVKKHAANPLFGEQYEWESRFDNLYPNVIYDQEEKLFKIWYFTWTYDPATTDVPRNKRKPGTYMKVRNESGKGLKEGLGYAVSKDGIHWKKPLMKVSPWKGKPSNLVAQPCHGAGIFKDLRERDPARRYKMFLKGQGIVARFSPDGINWGSWVSLPEVDAAGDTHNNALWSPELKRYVGFTRLWRGGRRVVGRTESRDFIYWTKAQPIMAGPREAQPYSMPVIRYAGVYLGLPAILRAKEDRTHTELAWSSDTKKWHRIDKGTPLIANSTKRGAYDWGTVYASYPIVHNGEIRIYYGACNAQHFDWRDGFLCLATLPLDRFAGYQPVRSREASVVMTKALAVSGPLKLSADVQRGGKIVVQVLDEQGKLLFASTPITRNHTEQVVGWSNAARLEKLIGKKVQLRFEFQRAKLYAIEL